MVLNFVIVTSRCLQCSSWDRVRFLSICFPVPIRVMTTSCGTMAAFSSARQLSPSITSSAQLGPKGSFGKRKFADRGDGNPVSHEPLCESTVYQRTQLVFLQGSGRFLPDDIRERSPESLD